jgi:hypothetical protein
VHHKRGDIVTSHPSSTTPPWQHKQLPYALKLMIMVVMDLVLIIALVSGITFLAIVPGMIINGPGPRNTISSMITTALGLGAVFGISLFGLIKPWPASQKVVRR